MNYYPRHLGDYARTTKGLTMLEHGAFTLLLDMYYANEKGIPKDKIYRVTGAQTKAEKEAVDNVLSEFFYIKNDVWINDRAEEEIEKSRAKAEASKENGKKGGRPKRVISENPEETQEKPTRLFLGSENETYKKAYPITNNQEPITNNQSINPQHSELLVGSARASPADIAIKMRELGIDAQSGNPLIHELSAQGISLETVEAACIQARNSKPPDERIGLNYVLKILERWASDAKKINVVGATKNASANINDERKRAADELCGRDRERTDDMRTINGETSFIDGY